MSKPSSQVLDGGAAVLADLGRLLRDEALELVQIEATYFVGRLLEAVHLLLPMVAASLKRGWKLTTRFVGRWPFGLSDRELPATHATLILPSQSPGR